MLVGETGCGKSALINSIANYIMGVTWKDSFRFTLIDVEKESESTQVSFYNFFVLKINRWCHWWPLKLQKHVVLLWVMKENASQLSIKVNSRHIMRRIRHSVLQYPFPRRRFVNIHKKLHRLSYNHDTLLLPICWTKRRIDKSIETFKLTICY